MRWFWPSNLPGKYLLMAQKPIVYVGDGTLHVGHCHNGVLVEREFLIGQFLEGLLAGDQAYWS